MCLYKIIRGRSASNKRVKNNGSDPFGLDQKRRESEILAANVVVGDRFSRRWHKHLDDIVLYLSAEYTVTKIEGDLITLEASNEETLRLTREEFATELCYFLTKIQ